MTIRPNYQAIDPRNQARVDSLVQLSYDLMDQAEALMDQNKPYDELDKRITEMEHELLELTGNPIFDENSEVSKADLEYLEMLERGEHIQ
jgi:hypothetical protein